MTEPQRTIIRIFIERPGTLAQTRAMFLDESQIRLIHASRHLPLVDWAMACLEIDLEAMEGEEV